MKIPHLINQLLAPLNICIQRRSEIQRLESDLQSYKKKITDLSEFIQQKKSSESVDDTIKHQISSYWSLYDSLSKLVQTRQLHDPRFCPICSFSGIQSSFKEYAGYCIFGGGDLIRFQCPNCDVIFGPDKMLSLSSHALSEEYKWHYRVFSEGDSTELELRAFYAMQPKRDGVYLNWGSGTWSNTIEFLRSEGWNVYGYEPFSSQDRYDKHLATDSKSLSQLNFDGIFSNNVLEHLSNPIDDILEMKKLLKPGGVLLHATPCFEYLYEYTRFHLFFFLGRSRNILADRTKMKLKEFFQDGHFMYILLEDSTTY
jgi:SAM-dependent methyltransferase